MIYGLFKDPREAESAMRDIEAAGLSDEKCHLNVHTGTLRPEDLSYAESDSGRGLLTGLVTGGLAGPLMGWLMAVPLQILPLGAWSALGLGALGGCVLGGLAGLLAGAGLPDERLLRLNQAMARGEVLLAAETGSMTARDIVDRIFRQHGAQEAA